LERRIQPSLQIPIPQPPREEKEEKKEATAPRGAITFGDEDDILDLFEVK